MIGVVVLLIPVTNQKDPRARDGRGATTGQQNSVGAPRTILHRSARGAVVQMRAPKAPGLQLAALGGVAPVEVGMEGHLSSKRTGAADWPRHGLALNEASGEPSMAEVGNLFPTREVASERFARAPYRPSPGGSPWRRHAAEGHQARAGGAETSGIPEQRPRGGPHSCDGR